MRLIIFLVIVSMTAAQFGCASIVSGQSQKISVESVPPGAQVAVDGRPTGKTPLATKVSRNRNHEIRIALEGYDEESRVTYQGYNYVTLGNILVGGIIGMVVDLATGAGYSVKPDRFVVTLTEAGEKGREGKLSSGRPMAQPAPPAKRDSPQ